MSENFKQVGPTLDEMAARAGKEAKDDELSVDPAAETGDRAVHLPRKHNRTWRKSEFS
jgi:hypothetical protein